MGQTFIGLVLRAVMAVSAALSATPTSSKALSTPTQPALPISAVKLVNYFPANAAWTNMWQNWNRSQIDHDFGVIASLHANTVRLVVSPYQFGYPLSPTLVSELNQTIALAQSHGLRVQLTIFDWFSDWTNLSGSDAWAQALLAPYKNNTEVAFVEVKNEIDPTNAPAMTWARHEITFVKSVVGTVPVTVSLPGVATLADLQTLKNQLAGVPIDFYDVHYYAYAGSAASSLAQAKAIVAPKPLFVGETGMSTYPTSGKSPATEEAAQVSYLQTVENAAQRAGLAPAAPWALNDFTAAGVPAQAQLSPSDYDFGLYRTDGSAKPSAAYIASVFAH